MSKGIGLISMKQIAGNFLGDKPQGSILDDVVRRVPVLAERKLTPYQGLLHAIWTDERLSAVCTTMRNTDHIRENTDAAVRYEPLKQADIGQLRDATLAHGSDALRRLRRPMFDRGGDQGRAGQPHAVPDVPRAPWRPGRGPPAATPSCPPRPATGRAPTWKPPGPPAPIGSTSRGSCPWWTGTWREGAKPSPSNREET